MSETLSYYDYQVFVEKVLQNYLTINPSKTKVLEEESAGCVSDFKVFL